MGSKSIDDVLYPKIEPYATGMLPVSERHTIAWECAEPDGIPVIVIHGGPGGGSQPSYDNILILRNGTSSIRSTRLWPINAIR